MPHQLFTASYPYQQGTPIVLVYVGVLSGTVGLLLGAADDSWTIPCLTYRRSVPGRVPTVP